MEETAEERYHAPLAPERTQVLGEIADLLDYSVAHNIGTLVFLIDRAGSDAGIQRSMTVQWPASPRTPSPVSLRTT